HGSKFKLHPVCHLSQASILRVTHGMLFFCISKYTLDLLFSQPIKFLVWLHMSGIFCHLDIVVPNMPCHRFLTLCTFSTHRSCRTTLTHVGAAFVFPVAVPVRCGIMQRMVFRTDYIVKVFIVHIRPP